MNDRNYSYKKISYYREYYPDFPSEDYDKGRAFENFVVSKFTPNYFRLIEWRSDKFYNGVYAYNSMLPDMVWIFESNYCSFPFAVECKWRHGFNNYKIDWAKDYQLDIYRTFQQEEQMPVFVVIGIGGQPHNPTDVYIIPLHHIANCSLEKSYLNPYKRYNPDANFFLDVDIAALS